MTTTQIEKPWDFSNVLNLINTLSNKESATKSTSRSLDARPGSGRSHSHQVLPRELVTTQSLPPNGLGDFSQVWQYLGSPNNVAAPQVPPAINTSPTLQQRLPGKLEYTSDGAMYTGTTSRRPKSLQWRDETDAGVLTDIAPNKSEEDSEEKDEDRLSKKQRYKRNKRERQRLAAAEEAKRAASDVDSEADIQSSRNAPARKAGVHTPERRQSRYNLRARDAAGNAVTADLTASSERKTNASFSTLSRPIAVPPFDKTNLPEPSSEPFQHHKSNANTSRARQQSEPAFDLAVSRVEEAQKHHAKQWPVSNPFSAHAKSFLPASVQPSPQSAARQPFPSSVTSKALKDATQAVQAVQIAMDNGSTPIATQSPKRSHRHVIEPKVVRSGDDRHWAFLLKLIANFYEDRGNLIKPANLSNHSKDPRGIHVFVDASNIFIGFHDQLKRARNIPTYVRVPSVNLSFDALSLLMERRRPVAKRVLAGSTPHIPAFDVAREIGYECSILDKVYKARELTERQKFFYGLDHKHRKPGNRNSYHSQSGGNGYTSGGNGSGSETMAAAVSAPTHAPERFVEQGVDEILHLKILESVVDVDEPTTIVLATGDAAQAEYSQGFLVMVERALKKGWSVELVSWSKNINGMYKDAKFRRQWGKRFKLIELDDYAEELLDM